MPRPAPTNPDPFRRLAEIMERLLAPDGCPWDKEQTHASIKPYLIEECYEVVEAIDDNDMDALREELGDIGLHVIFHAAMARRAGHFDLDQVYEGICEKLIRRHPHVFGDVEVSGTGEVLKNWEQIKKAEKEKKAAAKKSAKVGADAMALDDAAGAAAAAAPATSMLDGVPKALPALNRAHRIQEKAARAGFDWPDVGPVWKKVAEEVEELKEAAASGDARKMEDECGDLLFAVVNLARFLKVHPEEALQSTSNKFARRFRHIEKRAREMGRETSRMTLEEMDALWDEAKALEKKAQ